MAPLVVVRSSKAVGTARVQQIIQGFLESAETVEQALDLTVTNRERLCVTAPDIIGKLKVLVKEVKESSTTTRHGSRTSGKPAQGPKKAGSQPTVISGSNSVNKKKRPHDDLEADESKILANKEKKSKKAKKERKES